MIVLQLRVDTTHVLAKLFVYNQPDALHLMMHCIALPQVYMSLAYAIVQHHKWLRLNPGVAALGRAFTIKRSLRRCVQFRFWEQQ